MSITKLILIHRRKIQDLELRLVGLEDEERRQYIVGQITAYDVAITGLETLRKSLIELA